MFYSYYYQIMCGIFWYYEKWKFNDGSAKKLVEDALDLLDHRWPDATGHFFTDDIFLWHKRLSIIDLSTWANQPFQKDGYVLIFNGEIYNYKELRQELTTLGCSFTTESDTEVLLEAFRMWWKECTKKLDGMRAFAMYDEKKSELVVSRDRIGEKPLYYFRDGETLCFGSEIPALKKALVYKKLTTNYSALANFNTYNFQHIPAPFSAIHEILKLKPGYTMIVDCQKKTMTQEKYFFIEPVVIEKNPVEQFLRIFKKSVEQSCYSDVPVGVLLSWGIDSSLITACLKDRSLTTYSLWYNETDPELQRAAKIAHHLGVKNKQLHFKDLITPERLLRLVEENLKVLWEPIHLFQVVYSDILLKVMKEDWIKVVIGGNGADELFYGYDGMNTLRVVSFVYDTIKKTGIHEILPMEARKFFDPAFLKAWFYMGTLSKKSVIDEKFREFIYLDTFKEYASEIPSKSLIDVFSRLGLRIENEHSITMVWDISWSKNSMEVRSPFLSREIINFACSLPLKWKVPSFFDKKHNKHILKKALEEFLPAELVYQKKMWFGYGISYGELTTKILEEFGERYPLHTDLEKFYKEKPQNNFEVFLVNLWRNLR